MTPAHVDSAGTAARDRRHATTVLLVAACGLGCASALCGTVASAQDTGRAISVTVPESSEPVPHVSGVRTLPTVVTTAAAEPTVPVPTQRVTVARSRPTVATRSPRTAEQSVQVSESPDAPESTEPVESAATPTEPTEPTTTDAPPPGDPTEVIPVPTDAPVPSDVTVEGP